MQQSVAGCNVAVLGLKQASVTMNSSSALLSRPIPGSTPHRPGQVIITPLSTVHRSATPTGATSSLEQQRQALLARVSRPEASVGVVSKILLKAMGSLAKKDPKTFTLRNVDTVGVNSEEKLKLLIRTQLHKDIVSGEFDVGYLQGSTVVSIRSSQDLLEIWNDVRKGTKTILWCNGLKEGNPKSRKRKQADDSDVDSDNDAGKTTSKRKRFTPEAREKKVKETVSKLKEKHGNSFTQMQYRIWSEMIIGSVHF